MDVIAVAQKALKVRRYLAHAGIAVPDANWTRRRRDMSDESMGSDSVR